MMDVKPIETKVSTLIANDLVAMGYELVRVKRMSGGEYLTLQIMAERADRKPMKVEDCVTISHAVSEKLDTDKELVDRYTLEISSPGIDRPLMKLADFERYKGHQARIDLDEPLKGQKQKRFQGDIVQIKGQEPEAEIEFNTETGVVSVPFKAITRAKLILTKALMDAENKTNP